MTLLVFSDSHGRLAPMEKVRAAVKPDAVLFLGDGLHEFERLSETDPGSTLYLAVRGNCDLFASDIPTERLFEWEGIRILMLHGHTRYVKHGTEALLAYGREVGADLILYGHTHRAECRYLSFEDASLYLVNPGSIGASYEEAGYACIEIKNKQILVNCAAYREGE